MKTFALKLAGFALTVLGSKLWLIGAYGLRLPLWDSWKQEGLRIYKPWLEGTFSLGMLFLNNYVHRIGCTRLFDVALFVLNAHQWEPWTQTVANALLHTVGSTFILAVVYTQFGRGLGDLALGAMGVCLVFPFAYVNTLWGFQSQFYFLIFFSAATLWGFLGDAPGPAASGPWRAGLQRGCGGLAAFLACLTMGSGFLAAGLSAILIAGRAWWRGEWRRAAPGLLVCVTAALVGLGLLGSTLTQTRGGQPEEQAQDMVVKGTLERWGHGADLLLDVGATTGWPLGGGVRPWAGPLLYAPFGIWLWRQWRDRRRTDRHAGGRWFFAGLGGWSLLQGISIGLLRGVPPGSRHLDVLCFGWTVNLLALGMLRREAVGDADPPPRRALGPALAVCWLIGTGWGLIDNGLQVWQRSLPEWRDQGVAYERSVERFAVTGDPASLQDGSNLFLAHPPWRRLAQILRDPGVRAALSSTLTAPGHPGILKTPAPAHRMADFLVPAAIPCGVLGLLLLVIAFGRDLDRVFRVKRG